MKSRASPSAAERAAARAKAEADALAAVTLPHQFEINLLNLASRVAVQH